jgi:hypothetical protein
MKTPMRALTDQIAVDHFLNMLETIECHGLVRVETGQIGASLPRPASSASSLYESLVTESQNGLGRVESFLKRKNVVRWKTGVSLTVSFAGGWPRRRIAACGGALIRKFVADTGLIIFCLYLFIFNS